MEITVSWWPYDVVKPLEITVEKHNTIGLLLFAYHDKINTYCTAN